MCAAGVMPSQWMSGFVPDDFRVWYMPCVMSLEYMRGCKVANKMASFAALDAVVVARWLRFLPLALDARVVRVALN